MADNGRTDFEHAIRGGGSRGGFHVNSKPERIHKNLKFQSQWSLKQQTGQYNAKGTTLEEWLGDTQSQTQETAPGERGDDTLRKIHQKLDAGGKLTQKERDYLQDHDPEAYQELIKREREQKAYEEAQQLQIGRINASLSRVQSIEHDPHIPLSQKLEIAMAEKIGLTGWRKVPGRGTAGKRGRV